ncbi:MAG: cation:proton antiporter, partial [Dehalococcoidia bacterium]
MPLDISADDLFLRFAVVLALAAAAGMLARVLRQPPIIAFIGVGIMVGPLWLNLVTDRDLWDLLATVGIALLLFVVGLRLDVETIRRTGPVALATGLGQVGFTSLVGFLIALALGLDVVPAIYVAVALTFSSTIIIVKLLSDKREIDSLHGRIAVGFLIVQDMVVIVVLIALSSFGVGSEEETRLQEVLLVMARGAGMLVVVGLMMRFVLPTAVRVLAGSQELLVLGAIAWAVGLAAGAEWIGFSQEVGAFLAGVALAPTDYRNALSSRLTSLRDFLLLFFFISLGATLDLTHIGANIWPSLIFSVFVLVGNPLIVVAIMGVMGYRKRTGFLAGLTVAQISEFSLILAALGVSLGHIDSETLGLVTLVGIITIGTSTYLILYSHAIYDRVAPLLGIFERSALNRDEISGGVPASGRTELILFGVGRYGGGILDDLVGRGIEVLAMDFDPEAVASRRLNGGRVIYGDATDPDIHEYLPFSETRWVVSSIPSVQAGHEVAQNLRQAGYRGKVALTAPRPEDTEAVQGAGADLVLTPFSDAAQRAGEIIVER